LPRRCAEDAVERGCGGHRGLDHFYRWGVGGGKGRRRGFVDGVDVGARWDGACCGRWWWRVSRAL
jgi:hypothetical protein